MTLRVVPLTLVGLMGASYDPQKRFWAAVMSHGNFIMPAAILLQGCGFTCKSSNLQSFYYANPFK